MKKRILSIVLGLVMVAAAVVNPLANEAGTVTAADAAALPTDVTFDDLGTMVGMDSQTFEPKKNINLVVGSVMEDETTGKKNGFSFLMPKAQLDNYLYFGLYNNDINYYNEGGYHLSLGKGASDTEVTYWLYASIKKDDVTWFYEEIGKGVVNVTGDDIKVSVWLEGTNATTQEPLLNMIICDTKADIYRETTKVVEPGNYMSVCNNSPTAIDLKTVNPVEMGDDETGDAEVGDDETGDADLGDENLNLDETDDTEDETDASAQSESNKPAVTTVIIVAAVVVVAAAIVAGVILFKRKKKQA